MKRQPRPKEVKRLDVFVGNWQNTGRMLPGRFGPGGEVAGTTSYSWAIGDRWLQYVSKLDLPGMGAYEVQGGVAYNAQTGKYDAYAVNSLGVLMVYVGEWADDTTLVFLKTHPLPAGEARIVYQVNPDGTIHMKSDSLSEDGKFETYFETEMVRVE